MKNDSFEQAVRENGDSLVFFANSYVHSYEIAEEIVQDAFVYLLIHKKHFDFPEQQRSYLFKTVRTGALNYLKKNKRHADEDFGEVCSLVASSDDTELQFIIGEDRRALYRALNAMPVDYREVLYLLYFENMSYEQAAGVMKKNVKQIANLAVRAKKKAGEMLGKEDLFNARK